jgi:hypothetical protein
MALRSDGLTEAGGLPSGWKVITVYHKTSILDHDTTSIGFGGVWSSACQLSNLRMVTRKRENDATAGSGCPAGDADSFSVG